MGNRAEELVICDCVRTPFTHGNRLKGIPPEDLLATVISALVKRNDLNPELVSGVVTGTVLQDSRSPNVARSGAIKGGLPYKTSDYTVQTNCNSAFMGLLTALGSITSGLGDLYICTGVESMSRYGLGLRDLAGEYRKATDALELLKKDRDQFLATYAIVDCLDECLTDKTNRVSMIEIGEIMANLFSISREEQDSYTLENLIKAVSAVEEKKLTNYMVPLGEQVEDSYPLNRKRMIGKPELFGRTPVIFGEDNPLLNRRTFFEKHRAHLEKRGLKSITPTLTMYTSSIPGDGAGGCILTTESFARKAGLTPRFRLVNWAVTGVDPVIMGVGPNEAVEKLFSRPRTARAEGLTMNDMDQIELHEAFASQVLSVFKESERQYGRKWDRNRINPYGGSLAYTHPLGATNYRLLADIFSRFDEDKEAKLALATGCAGGGQGTALILERY